MVRQQSNPETRRGSIESSLGDLHRLLEEFEFDKVVDSTCCTGQVVFRVNGDRGEWTNKILLGNTTKKTSQARSACPGPNSCHLWMPATLQMDQGARMCIRVWPSLLEHVLEMWNWCACPSNLSFRINWMQIHASTAIQGPEGTSHDSLQGSSIEMNDLGHHCKVRTPSRCKRYACPIWQRWSSATCQRMQANWIFLSLQL